MSPLWRDQIQVLMTPTGLSVARIGRGLHPSIQAKMSMPVGSGTGSDLPKWTEALMALGPALQPSEWAKGDLTIVLSNHFVRYQVIPWRDEFRDETELSHYAGLLLRQGYGRPAANWSVEVSIDRVGNPCVACAVDTMLLEELKAYAAHDKRRLVSVRPLLTEAFNWAKEWLTQDYQWLVIVEEGMVCAALMGKHRWVAVRSWRVGDDWPSELVALLEREQLLIDEAESARTVLLHVVSGLPMDLPANHWTVRHLGAVSSQHAPASVLSCVI